jgi:hypothetical protein
VDRHALISAALQQDTSWYTVDYRLTFSEELQQDVIIILNLLLLLLPPLLLLLLLTASLLVLGELGIGVVKRGLAMCGRARCW